MATLPATAESAFQPHIGSKRLVIKNLRQATSGNGGQYYEKTLKEFDAALYAVFMGWKPEVPLERLYRGAEDLCRSGKAESLYQIFKTRIEDHLQRKVLPRIVRAGGISHQDTLTSVVGEWMRWSSHTVWYLTI